MNNHKSIDYKLSVVNYYNRNNFSIEYVCDIFGCSKQSLSRRINRYKKEDTISRRSRKPMSYKITKNHVRYALKL